MAKIDLRNAFRLCPIRKQDWLLLGVYWKHRYFIDKCLPFGLQSVHFYLIISHLVLSGY